MIRRDYILRMIEEFLPALSRLRALKQGQRWAEAGDELDAEFKKLVGDGAQAVARLSETELLARLMQDGPTHLIRDKTLMLTTLLKEAGDVAAAEDRTEESRECYLKALHLLLDVLGRGEVFEWPEFVPKVEMLVAALQSAPLPVQTLDRLFNGDFESFAWIRKLPEIATEPKARQIYFNGGEADKNPVEEAIETVNLFRLVKKAVGANERVQSFAKWLRSLTAEDYVELDQQSVSDLRDIAELSAQIAEALQKTPATT